MTNASRGEVWLMDLGMTAKVRPAVILSVRVRDDERAVFAMLPHTTALRGGRFASGSRRDELDAKNARLWD
jgi:mRNA interferase MazF